MTFTTSELVTLEYALIYVIARAKELTPDKIDWLQELETLLYKIQEAQQS